MAHLASLADSVDYARKQCAAAQTTIELMADGFYAVIHQEDGWPRQFVSAGAAELPTTPPRSQTTRPNGTPSPAGFRDWLKKWSRIPEAGAP